MEFILAQQAKLADRQIQAIRKLVQTGIKLVIQIAAAQKKTETLVAVHEERMARLEVKRSQTEADIKRMLAALIRQRPNGRR